MMEFERVTALVLLTVVLGIVVGRQEKEFSVILTMITVCIVAYAILSYLQPILGLVQNLGEIGKMQDGLLGILLKAVGIALISEVAAIVCTDAGNSTLAKTMHLLGMGAILYLSIPIIELFLNLMQDVLGEL